MSNLNDQDKNGSNESASEKLRRILKSRDGNRQKFDDVSRSFHGKKDNDDNDQPPHTGKYSDSRGVLPKEKAEAVDQTHGHIGTSESDRADQQLGNSSNIMGMINGILSKLKAGIEKFKKSKFVARMQNRKLARNYRNNPKGCIVYGFLAFTFMVIIIGIVILSFLIYQYFHIASDLPSINDLQEYASQFETTSIYDRNGNLIYEIIDPNAGRRTFVKLDEISPELIAATIATEDKDFYTNPGFDPWGILRALWQNYTSGKVVSGASTITQQLARTLLFSPEERTEISTRRKAREIVLAAEITRKYSKSEILELYLNENNYGNYSYGIEAAAEAYFNTTADQLNLAQASFLAGLPQAPALYDIFTNREASLLRQMDVLNLMYMLSTERGCISVAQSKSRVCVSLDDAVAAAQEIEKYPFQQRLISMPYPHWVNFIRAKLEEQFDPQTIYRSGFKVYTTLDPKLQNYARAAVKDQVDALAENEATDGALVAIQPDSGQILAMIGSADFFNEAISGQVNMAIQPRQPGSSIKPITYAAAFEKGWTPATLIWDVPSEFPPSGNPNDTRAPYKPVNYDGKFHGPVLLRTALASSYNIPAVKALDFVGIYDDPDTPQDEGLISFAERLGISTLTREDYGLSLTLGGGDVSLLELTGAYAIFANGGASVSPYAIESIVDHLGNIVYEHALESEAQIIRTEHAYLISDILSDNSARSPAFGSNSILNLPFKAAVKTGTTNDFRDNWTVGYTPDVAVGVWIGNADYSEMKNISGVTGAAPLWNNVMQWIVEEYHNGSPTAFHKPAAIENHVICAVSGTKPSEKCSNQRSEIFANGQPPLGEEHDLWQEIAIDTWTNLKAGSACTEFTEEKLTINVLDKWAIKWLKESSDGENWLKNNGFTPPVIFTPEDECAGDDPRPTIVFVGMQDGMNVTSSPMDVYAVINATKNYKSFILQYGVGNNPSKWKTLKKGTDSYKQPHKLISWDVYEANANRVTLRIILKSTIGTEAEKKIHLNFIVPTRTPTPTEVPVATATLEPTETSAPTPSPTNTLEPTSTP